MIIQEFTSQPSKLVYFFAQFFNELLVLKCGLLIQKYDYKIESLFEKFLLQVIRPYTYFIQQELMLFYSIGTFVLLQLLIIFWVYLLNISGDQEKKTYIQLINKYESSSTLQFSLIYIWKLVFLMLSEFLSLIMIEGCFVILFDEKIDNIFCLISSIIMLLEILVIVMLQQVFMNQSLSYIPRQLNQIIRPTLLVYLSKLLKIIVLCLFTSSITNKSIMVLVILILNGLLELYMLLILSIKLDRYLVRQNVLMQCLIICVSIQQIINIYIDQSLYFIVVNPCHSIIQITISCRPLKTLIVQQKFKLSYQKIKRNYIIHQQMTDRRNSEYRLVNKIFISYHQKSCRKQVCYCNNEEMVMIKLESIILKDLIKKLKAQIQQSQQQSSLFYIQYIQLLIQNGKCFDALNVTQKVLNQFNRRTQQFKKPTQLIKGQISLQQKILFKLLQQQILISIKYSIQSRSTGAAKHYIIKQAIRSLQQKVDSEKILQEQFNVILKAKMDFLDEIAKKPNLEVIYINNQALKIIKQIEELKKRLVNNFEIVPTHNNQSLLLFFQIEILNDLINSQTINTMNTQLDDQEQIVNANNIYQEFATQYSYVTFILKEEDNIELVQDGLNKAIRIGSTKYTSFEEMVPSSLVSAHKYLMKDFFQTGQNKYYLNIGQSFIQISIGVISPIEMCLDISFDLSMNQLLSTAFIRLASNNILIHYFLLDGQLKIREISQLLYQKILEYPVNQKMIFMDQSIFAFIPTLAEKDFLHDRTLGLYQINFPTNNNKSITTHSKYSQKSIEIFQGVISVSVRKINQKNTYYILEITDLKSDKKVYDSITLSNQQQYIEVDEKEIINIPFDMCSQPEQSNFNQVVQQQLTSRLDSQRPLLFTSLGECLDGQIDNVKGSQSQLSNKLENSVQSKHKESKSDEVLKQFDDQGSQISSVAAVRRSAYFKQFSIVNQLIFSKVFPLNIKIFNFMYFLYIFAGVINLSILIEQVQKLQNYQDLLALLSIKYDIYEPIESFLNTRYTIVGLNQAIATRVITQSVFNELVAFPRSNLARGYDDLKGNIFDVISRKEFQTFLKDRYFDSNWYISTNKGINKNMTFRSGILALLNYQYDFKLAYTVKTLQTDGPYFYYSYKNYIPLYTIFAQLNSDILDQLTNQLTDQSDQLTMISAPFNVFLGIVSIIYYIYLIRQRRLKNKILSLLYQQDNEVVGHEVQRLKQLQTLINSNYSSLYQYALDVQSFDENLKQQEGEFFRLINKKGNRTAGSRKNRQIKLYNFMQLGILLANIIVLLLLYYITISSLDQYLTKSKNTGQFYESLSNTGVDVLIIYAQREVLYRITLFSYLTSEDASDLQLQVDNSLESINKFSGLLLVLNQNDYLLDDSSLELFDKISSSSLCNYLPEIYANVSTTLCPQVLSGVLNQGLISTLNVMYNSIKSEKQVNNFTNRSNAQVPLRELEGATFTAKVIKELVKKLYSNLYNYTNEIKSNFQIIYICGIFIQLIFGFSIIYKISAYEREQMNILRKVVYLLPQSTLLFDDSFQRQIKIIMKQGQLV
ncbi:unnamed protein product (macronuclear) [Paramecium tetraurelia]|uniref:Transmembrane protein n=1 Tax=Paramecium tetraurelia TaxID=5888 RepID=A0DD39_PARTE|nr:uncharacterized protein GSPATT00015815001 [Paramecium tetraurelia]CAK80956.1 unnamed protein product [Paramecium tetraurelia]|eukprot:XP_001448353.1 hypothetical protein (macronuclear) [Paramecium tetraurelia strain d4-2]